MTPLDLELAPGWREVAPRAEAPDLLVETGGELSHLAGDFKVLREFGSVGPVDCPLAFDPRTRTGYRYICESRLAQRDYSRLVAFDLETGATRTVVDLPLNQWSLWLLEWIEGREEQPGQLFGLLAMDRPNAERVVIEHRLFTMAPGEARPRLRPICRDAYRPLAFSRARRQMVFRGAEGIYLVGLKGERLATLPLESGPSGHGASFDPSGSVQIALGGEGIYLWNVETGGCEQIARQGRFPVWSADGRRLFYVESSGTLCSYDREAGDTVRLVGLRNNRLPEFWHARPVRSDRSGRFLALPLTIKRLRGVSRSGDGSSAGERVYEHRHTLCVLDLERKELWRRDGGFANALRWV